MRGLKIVGAVALAGCLDAPVGVALLPAPAIDAAVALTNPHNAVSAVVSVRVCNADSVSVRFHPTADDSVTPAMAPVGDAASIPVLGLRPEQRYVLRAVAYGPGGTVVGDALELTTGLLPSDLPHYMAGGADPSPGYVVLAAGMYGVVIDNAGRVVWYRRFDSVVLAGILAVTALSPSCNFSTPGDDWVGLTRALLHAGAKRGGDPVASG